MDRLSSYLEYLPDIYRDHPFIGRFLQIFEKMLTGIDDDVPQTHPGIEQVLDVIRDYFNPTYTDLAFLDWLAGWLALELPGEWPEAAKRELIGRIVPLYSKRGTMEGIEEFLKIYVGAGVTINEWYSPFQIGKSSTVGLDTALDGGPPDFFSVQVILPEPDPEMMRKKEQAVREIIDREKPAHTYYQLEVIVPTLQIGVHSTIGLDTLLG